MRLLERKTFHQFLTFACIGVVNTLIDFAVYFILTRYIPIFHHESGAKYVANVISFFTGATFSFFANRMWTFKRVSTVTLKEITRFYSTNISGIILNSVLLAVSVQVFALHDLVGKVIATGCTVIWNFILQKFWVFKHEKTS